MPVSNNSTSQKILNGGIFIKKGKIKKETVAQFQNKNKIKTKEGQSLASKNCKMFQVPPTITKSLLILEMLAKTKKYYNNLG